MAIISFTCTQAERDELDKWLGQSKNDLIYSDKETADSTFHGFLDEKAHSITGSLLMDMLEIAGIRFRWAEAHMSERSERIAKGLSDVGPERSEGASFDLAAAREIITNMDL